MPAREAERPEARARRALLTPGITQTGVAAVVRRDEKRARETGYVLLADTQQT